VVTGGVGISWGVVDKSVGGIIDKSVGVVIEGVGVVIDGVETSW
jgi:hypothetical protein